MGLNILVTGQDGYIGSVLVPILKEAGHAVFGCDMFYYSKKDKIPYDIRERRISCGFDAVIHLAALSNDPLGEMNPELTFEINHKATVALAEEARRLGVKRFIFSSSCSVYGKSNIATEDTPVNPLTPYASSKVRAEQDISTMASDKFTPVFLRNATAYGWSPNFRSDIVLNNLVSWAYTKGEIKIMSDGTPWRSLVHVEDICQAFLLSLEASQEKVHNQVFNVGSADYQVRDLANRVQHYFPDCKITYAGGGADPRDYRVNYDKIMKVLDYTPEWTIDEGIAQMKYEMAHSGFDDLSKFTRLSQLKKLIQDGKLREDLRWISYPA